MNFVVLVSLILLPMILLGLETYYYKYLLLGEFHQTPLVGLIQLADCTKFV